MRLDRSTVRILVTLLLATPALADSPPDSTTPHPRLAQRIAALEAEGVSVGLAMRSLDGRPRVLHEASRPLVPASTMKLLTTACALETLGPAWTTRTRFLAGEHPKPSGTLAGPLYIEAGGDPLLRGEDLWVAIEALARRNGLRRVEGDVVVDASLFTGGARPASWPKRQVTDPYDAPQGAFAVGYASTEVIVRPGPRPGTPADVSLFPLADVIAVTNKVKTGERTKISMTLVPADSGPGTIVVSGTIATSRKRYREWVRLGDADAGGRAAVASLLRRAGIAVTGRVRSGELPDQELESLHVVPSRALAELVRAINKYSSNFGAETLLRHLPNDEGLPAGNSTEGLSRLDACAERWELVKEQRVLADASGYARANRLSPDTLVQAILHALEQPEWAPEWLASLPRAGEDGSLRRRLEDLEGRLRAKTGSLSGVAALAGVARDASGKSVAFALILNGERGTVGTAEVDELTRLLLAR